MSLIFIQAEKHIHDTIVFPTFDLADNSWGSCCNLFECECAGATY